MADRKREVGDYPGAWTSLERALVAADQGSFLAKLSGRLDAPRLELCKAQEDLAMAWLRDVRVPEGKSFADVVDPLLAVVTRGSIDADAVREADLLAHLGWAYFLKSRDRGTDIDPTRSYGQALAIDSDNPFANAFWGTGSSRSAARSTRRTGFSPRHWPAAASTNSHDACNWRRCATTRPRRSKALCCARSTGCAAMASSSMRGRGAGAPGAERDGVTHTLSVSSF